MALLLLPQAQQATALPMWRPLTTRLASLRAAASSRHLLRQHCSTFQAHSRTAACTAAASARPQVILGIESSCDDTAAAVVTSTGQVLGEAIAGQADIHAPWGGVVPSLAQEAHRAAIDRVVSQALQQAGLAPQQLDAVAVTVGPGLGLCLDVGVRKARALSREACLPLVPVHHMEAHALVARLAAGPDALQFPFLCLLVSGGHNLLVLVRGVGDYLQLGSTLDDALGEAYDKVARMLGLELKPHGGAALERLALEGDPQRYKFAVPMLKHANCDFSYAGLKTSVRLAIEAEVGDPSTSGRDQERADIAASFQAVAVKHLTQRVRRGVSWARAATPSLTHLVVAGGVACNAHVRQQLGQLADSEGLQLVLPPARWCTDNGVMVAWAGLERLGLGLIEPPLAPLNPGEDAAKEWVQLRPRWPLTSEKHEGSTRQVLSMKRPEKLATSLTDLTRQELERRPQRHQQQQQQQHHHQQQQPDVSGQHEQQRHEFSGGHEQQARTSCEQTPGLPDVSHASKQGSNSHTAAAPHSCSSPSSNHDGSGLRPSPVKQAARL